MGGGGLGPGGEEESYCLSKKRMENRKSGNQALGALRRSVCGGVGGGGRKEDITSARGYGEYKNIKSGNRVQCT